MKKLTDKQIEKIKQVFEKEPNNKVLAIQGNISVLMNLSLLIGENLNYSIVQKNLNQII